MSKENKQLGSPFSTGGGGFHFETHVQAAFVTLLLTGGFAPCLPSWPISKIKLQSKAGYKTDDLIIYTEKPETNQNRKILCQIKHSINIAEKDKVFNEVIQAAWNDFNNAELFSKNSDVIAVITGPLSATDINDTRQMLEWARYHENEKEYFDFVEMTHISSQKKQAKLKAFKNALKKANNDVAVPNKTIFDFLRHFHLLGYDLDLRAGVTLSLLHSLIGQFSQEKATALWTQIVDEVQSANKNAGTITYNNLSEELKTAFKQKSYAVIPSDLSIIPVAAEVSDWNQLPYATDLAIVNLLGSWNEQNNSDLEVIHQLTHKDSTHWLTNIREVLQHPENPLSLKNGKWRVVARKELWQALGNRLFDQDLYNLKKSAIDVLTERDPQFDLPIDKRFASSMYGKVFTYSLELRKGIAESLAILGNMSEYLINCSQHNPEYIAALTVREIFNDANWAIWGSLNDLLPMLAEAAPNEFLSAVENALQQSPCPFDELFQQEGSGIIGRNYLTGLLWALETLAWDEELLVRIYVILGELASHDPGGNWANRPFNSLQTILLPWYPQTIAPIEKRKAAIRTLQKEFPEIAWKLLLRLLPNQNQISTGSRKPLWRGSIPNEWGKNISNKEYWEQISYYSELIVSIAKNEIEKLNEVVNNLENLPQPSFEQVLQLLSSESVINLPEEQRLPLWASLTEFVLKHRRYSNAKWALPKDVVEKVDDIRNNLSPTNPLNLYSRLFSNQEHLLYEEKGNWEEQTKKLADRRRTALEEILAYGSINAIVTFTKIVKSPSKVGHTLGTLGQQSIDSELIPAFLETENENLAQLISGYVWSSQRNRGWVWVDRFDKSNWSIKQKSVFLGSLPFTSETWKRVKLWLDTSEGQYWEQVNENPYEADGNLDLAAGKLLKFGRPHAAINCLQKMNYDKQKIDKSQIARTLLAAISSKESKLSLDKYNIIELIKLLQNDPETNADELFQVEWAYLPFLDHYDGASPRLLEMRLASDPDFFCEVISLIYRSKKDNKPKAEPSESEKSIATNAWRLLHEWKTPPGTQLESEFSGKLLEDWVEKVKKSCTDSGHLEVALTHIGHILAHCPPDPQGLWIHQSAASELNAKDADDMRNGFSSELFNSRGAHWIDPTGKPERELAEQYRAKANEVENAGYQRLAVTLRDLAEEYDHEADRITATHGQDEDLE